MEIDGHSKGVLFCVVGVVILSPDSLLVNVLSSSLPIFTLIFYKYLIIFIVWLLGFLLLSHFYPNETEKFKDLGRLELLCGFVFGLVNVLINYAFYAENVAYVLAILAINPCFAAIFSHYLLHESTPPRTIVTCSICIAAVCYICSVSLGAGGGGTVLGILASLGASINYGLYFVLLRMVGLSETQSRDSQSGQISVNSDDIEIDNKIDSGGGVEDMKAIPSDPSSSSASSKATTTHKPKAKSDIQLLLEVTPCNIIAAFVCTVIAACFMRSPGVLNPKAGGMLFINSVLVIPISFNLLSVGPSYIPATEASLLALIVVVLGPIWVWLGGYEPPTTAALIGGAIILVTLAFNSYLTMREARLEREIAFENATASQKAVGAVPCAEVDDRFRL